MNKKINKNEIDLIELLIIIKNKFWQILIIISLSLAITLFYSLNQNPNKIILNAKTEVKSVSTFDESEYELYNTYLKQGGSGYSKKTRMYIKRDETLDDEFFLYDKIEIDKNEINTFEVINKKYLMSLFIDKLNDKKNIYKCN